MSIFEQYTGNIPLLFPTPDFNIELYKNGLTLTELSWDKNKKDDIDWIRLADYYNQEWMPYITYFSSLNNLKEIIIALDVDRVSVKMKDFNKIRKQRIYDKWESILNENINLR